MIALPEVDVNQLELLVSARFDETALTKIAPSIAGVRHVGYGVTGEKLDTESLKEEISSADLYILEFETVDRSVLDAAPRLRAIGCCRTGPEANVDIAAATELGIPVLFTPGRNAVSVAEYTIGLMISVARHLSEAYHLLKYTGELTEVSYSDKDADRLTVTSEWSIDPHAPFNRFQGVELSGKVLGLAGFGAIGREIAIRARAFGMSVIAYDLYVDEAQFAAAGVAGASLEEVASKSDFVAMAAKVTPQTTGLFSKRHFAMMKPDAYFINSARAALVDYDALYEALAGNRIAGAAIDVFTTEPISPEEPLRHLPNVLISPHLAGASRDIPRQHSRIIVEELSLLLAGSQPRFLKNPEVWAHRRPI